MNERMKVGSVAGEHEVRFSGRHAVQCWREPGATSQSADTSHSPASGQLSVDVEICVAPVLVCTHVVQTVGGGDNISAAALALQI